MNTKKYKKKILVWFYAKINLGDDLFIKILAERYPEIEFCLLVDKVYASPNKPSYDTVGFPDNCTLLLRKNIFQKARKYLYTNILGYPSYFPSDVEGVIFIGGSLFMEDSHNQPFYSSTLKLLKKFKRQGKKSFLLGANFGPFKTEKYVKRYEDYFSYFHDICFRDSKSYGVFNHMPMVRMASDIVFNLDLPYVPDNKKVGLSVIDLEDRDELKPLYNEHMKQLVGVVKKTIADGCTVSVYSFCEWQGDLKIAQQVEQELDEHEKKSYSIVNYVGDIQGFLESFCSNSLIVGVRFHATILGLLSNSSIVPIIYSKKTENVLMDIGFKHSWYQLDTMNKLIEKDIGALCQSPQDKNFGEYIKNSELQFEKLDGFLGYRK